MGSFAWVGRRWVGWSIGFVLVGASLWRFVIAAQERHDPMIGLSRREHAGLLLLQGTLALFAAAAWAAVAMGVREGDRRSTRVATVLLVVLAVGFAAIFLRPGLLDWGGYED
jgi:hypothetical protein